MCIQAVTSGILFSKLFTFVVSVLKFVFFTTCLSTTSFKFFKSLGTVFNLQKSKSFTFAFNLIKIAGTLMNLAMTNLSTSVFKTENSFLTAQADVSVTAASPNSFLVA